MKKRLRQELHYCKKYGIKNHLAKRKTHTNLQRQAEINRIDGMIRYISYIEPTFTGSPAIWADLLKKEKLAVGYGTNNLLHNLFAFYIDESLIKHNGKNVLAMAFVKVAVEDADNIEMVTNNILRRAVVDPFSGGRKENLVKRGLHYADSNEDLRKIYTDSLVSFPFNGYVAYKTFEATKDYAETYISLIKTVFPHRLMECDNASVQLIFEENSQIQYAYLNKTVQEIHGQLIKTENPRPRELGVAIGKKSNHPCFSIPDYLLGIFGSYATLKSEDKKERKELFFEKLRDKYRFILDADKNLMFTRKRSFVPWS